MRVRITLYRPRLKLVNIAFMLIDIAWAIGTEIGLIGQGEIILDR